jgi:hypothetical protein
LDGLPKTGRHPTRVKKFEVALKKKFALVNKTPLTNRYVFSQPSESDMPEVPLAPTSPPLIMPNSDFSTDPHAEDERLDDIVIRPDDSASLRQHRRK